MPTHPRWEQSELEAQIRLEEQERKLSELFPEGLDAKIGEVQVLIENNTEPPQAEE